MKLSLLALAIAALPALAQAESKPIDLSGLPSKTVHEVATLTPLALTEAGMPSMLLLDIPVGEVMPPHATPSGLRLLTVLSGEMSWGNGDTVDEGAETVYQPGDMLAIPAGADHWIAARSGPVRLQLVLMQDEAPVPAIQEQMK